MPPGRAGGTRGGRFRDAPRPASHRRQNGDYAFGAKLAAAAPQRSAQRIVPRAIAIGAAKGPPSATRVGAVLGRPQRLGRRRSFDPGGSDGGDSRCRCRRRGRTWARCGAWRTIRPVVRLVRRDAKRGPRSLGVGVARRSSRSSTRSSRGWRQTASARRSCRSEIAPTRWSARRTSALYSSVRSLRWPRRDLHDGG